MLIKRNFRSDIYLVLTFDKDENLIEICRVKRCFDSIKKAKLYQKKLNKKGHITALIKRRYYDSLY